MHPLNAVRVSKEDRGFDFNPDNGTYWLIGADLWFYHNEAGKYNERPIKGQILETIRCAELGNRDIIIVLCENSIERYPVMLDSNYDIIGNSKREVKNRAILCSTKYQRTKEILELCIEY